MKGMELCELFYRECVAAAIRELFPDARMSVGLLGSGSEVLGYDDEVSRDHMWGPRLCIFIEDASQSGAVYDALRGVLPRTFRGFSVGFGAPNERGISTMAEGEAEFRPMLDISTFSDYLTSEIGIPSLKSLEFPDWLTISEQKLLSLQKGRIFRDDLSIARELAFAADYPDDVWRYLIRSDWAAIAEEHAFVKRTASRGDDIGSRIICARIIHRLMHLCFLYEKTYAPYAKWFGTAFKELACYGDVAPTFTEALSENDMLKRERAVALSQKLVADIHNEAGLTPRVDTTMRSYYTRDILVSCADVIAEAMGNAVPIGALSTVGNLTALCENAEHFKRVRRLYE